MAHKGNKIAPIAIGAFRIKNQDYNVNILVIFYFTFVISI